MAPWNKRANQRKGTPRMAFGDGTIRASREEPRRLVELYLGLVEAHGSTIETGKAENGGEHSTPLCETINMRSREQRWPFSTTVAYRAVDGPTT